MGYSHRTLPDAGMFSGGDDGESRLEAVSRFCSQMAGYAQGSGALVGNRRSYRLAVLCGSFPLYGFVRDSRMDQQGGSGGAPYSESDV